MPLNSQFRDNFLHIQVVKVYCCLFFLPEDKYIIIYCHPDLGQAKPGTIKRTKTIPRTAALFNHAIFLKIQSAIIVTLLFSFVFSCFFNVVQHFA